MSKPVKHLKINTEVVKLDALFRYYVQGYDKVHGEAPELKDFYVDVGKGVAVVQTYVRDQPGRADG